MALSACRVIRPEIEGERVEFIKAGTPAPYDGYILTTILMARLMEKLNESR